MAAAGSNVNAAASAAMAAAVGARAAAESAGMTTATAARAGVTSSSAAAVTTTVLCPERYGQGESERRDGNQATHTTTYIISLKGKKGCLWLSFAYRRRWAVELRSTGQPERLSPHDLLRESGPIHHG
jgi:hypothetical protein